MTSASCPSRDEIVDALEQLAQYGVPGPGTAALLDVGSAAFVHYFEDEVLDSLVFHGGATCKIFEGAYGSGKTHLLQLLDDLARRRGMAVVRTDLSQGLSLENWQLIAQHILQNVEVRTSTGTARSLPNVLDALARDGRLNLDRLNAINLPHQGFANAIAQMSPSARLSDEGRVLVTRFLMGERVSVAQLKANGVSGVKHPLSGRNAELVIKTVLAALFRLGVPGTLLLFDENEQTFAFSRSTPPRRVVIAANLLRRLIDASANGSLTATVAVFAVLPGFVESCALAYAALGQRLQSGPPGGKIGWRSPVIPVQAVCSMSDPDAFLDGLIVQATALLAHCGVDGSGQLDAFRAAGRGVLARNAGSGSRRDVVKRIALLALNQL